ncbi:hypothetical protein ACFV9C_13670 [Kribbella sp. NPDC059898]|uniref:hypothetical protein n=1 Tax=Kribbella sp. NPDC059898 TaxID=3346995 RepID=UPI00365ACFC6
MTPTWVTLLVAFIGLAGILLTQWRADRRADRLDSAARTERRRSECRTVFTALFRAADALDDATGDVPGEPTPDAALAQLRFERASVEFAAPALAAAELAAVLAAGVRLVALTTRTSRTRDVFLEARLDYQRAVADLKKAVQEYLNGL